MILGDNRELNVERFTFPDGQPHFRLLDDLPILTGKNADIVTRFTSANDILDALLAAQVLRRYFRKVSLRVSYMLGARMDRPISNSDSATLHVITRMIAGSSYFDVISVLDPHSFSTIEMLSRDLRPVYEVLPYGIVHDVLRSYSPSETVLVAPDAGATDRVNRLARGTGFDVTQAEKVRDSQTGKLSGFRLLDYRAVRGKRCLIVDDICDGGGTFSGVADEIEAAGGLSVDLYVTHGIFSKGLPIPGISVVWTTTSYQRMKSGAGFNVYVLGKNWWKEPEE